MPGHAFEVTTPQARLTITGTKFDVKTDQTQTELALLKGSVRFASLANQQAVDVTAGHASTVAGYSAPTQPRQVDARLVTAWARQDSLEVGKVARYSSEDLELLGDITLDALMPVIPDYRTWSYERFRDEMRPWFAEQFPWAMELEKALNKEYGIEADYLDVLVISGDIWQFKYSGPMQTGNQIPTFDPEVVEHLANWYDLDSKFLLEAVRRFYTVGHQSGTEHTGETFADAIHRWRTDLATINGGTADGLTLFTLQASTYLHYNYAAVYQWVREHPEEAERLLTRGNYTSLLAAMPLLPNQPQSVTTLLDRVNDQFEICQKIHQCAQSRLSISYTQECSNGFSQMQYWLLKLVPDE